MKNDRPAWLANKQTNNAPKSRVRAISDATFEREVVASEIPVLVDFWAPWCGPCKMVAPVVERLAEEYEGRVKFVKMDTESNPGVPGAMEIRSIPTLLIFKGKDVVESKIGAGSIDEMRNMLDRSLGIKKPGLLAKLFG
jgi:thioredoxin 1